jgi:Tol biopolymer transport system component
MRGFISRPGYCPFSFASSAGNLVAGMRRSQLRDRWLSISTRPFRAPVALSVLAAVVAVAAARATGGAGAGETRWIVFSAHPEGSGAAQLFRIQTNGEGIQQITKGRLIATNPAFSPNGNRIAFTRLGSGIFTVELDGTGLRRLTSGPRDNFPVYSRDGKRIAFIRPYREQWRLHVMTASGAKLHRLAQAPPAGRPTWSGDGKAILTPALGDLYKVDSRTGKILHFYGMTLDLQTTQTATLSPNRRKIAYVGPRISTGPPDCGEGRCPQYGLYLASVPKPHKPRKIVNDTGPAGWSPDGKTLVFVAKGAVTLWVVASKQTTALSTGTHVATGDSPPAWQPR